MKAQELIINCCYTNNGTAIPDILKSSFAAILKREVEKIAPGVSGHV